MLLSVLDNEAGPARGHRDAQRGRGALCGQRREDHADGVALARGSWLRARRARRCTSHHRTKELNAP